MNDKSLTCKYMVRKMLTYSRAISQENIEKRKKFAEKHESWKNDDWGKVIFSDESFLCAKKGGHKIIRLLEGENIDDDEFVDADDDKNKILVWGAICDERVVDLIWINGTINQQVYENEILEKSVKTLAFLDDENGIFMLDNAPPHWAKTTTKWFQDNKIKKMFWPPQSPDLNPIENIWAFIKNEIWKCKINSKEDVWVKTQEAWNSPKCNERIWASCKSLPNRIQLLKEKQGKRINY